LIFLHSHCQISYQQIYRKTSYVPTCFTWDCSEDSQNLNQWLHHVPCCLTVQKWFTEGIKSFRTVLFWAILYFVCINIIYHTNFQATVTCTPNVHKTSTLQHWEQECDTIWHGDGQIDTQHALPLRQFSAPYAYPYSGQECLSNFQAIIRHLRHKLRLQCVVHKVHHFLHFTHHAGSRCTRRTLIKLWTLHAAHLNGF
jgi:hypothetical protein